MTNTLNLGVFLDGPSKNHDREKQTFVEELWRQPLVETHIEALSAYFELLKREVYALLDTKSFNLSSLDFEHVLTIRDAILRRHSDTQEVLRKEVAEQLKTLNLPNEAISLAIMFVIRLLLMIKVKQYNGTINAQSHLLQISDNQNLKSVVDTIQTAPSLGYWNTISGFPPWFNVIDLEKKAGLRIDWTHYITEHLTIQGDTLYLFCNIEALKHINGAQELTSKFFKEDFINETVRTVHLFFPETPHGYSSSQYLTWFHEHGEIKSWQRSLASLNTPTVSRLYNEYPVWNQRLAWVLEASKNQPNMGIKRIWQDDRDLSLWWTRWALITAVFLAVVFGLIQSITGIIQVVYAGRE
ncbi:unnamed protein product [Fusarium graminearum]|nr:hypothetical protein HG531_003819 [Fusarium graminearum]CAG1966946.1 unnamed protein product [Fusarium graminearum]CAG1969715.1 unnamed protein product [Fusarium graminearum]